MSLCEIIAEKQGQKEGKVMSRDITPLINNVKKVLETHKISVGNYARFTQGEKEMVSNEYGCADAANILYTIGEFPMDVQERRLWVETLQNMQEEETGLFREETHFPLHTTAHCISALELFDARPRYKLVGLEQYKTREGLYKLLESLEWKKSPWNNSHMGAGIYAALNVAGEATPEWNKWYFDWFWKECDPETGLWRVGYADKEDPNIFRHMAGSFHYLFNHEYARMPLRYPEKMIDSCLHMYKKNYLLDTFGQRANFIEMDWVYCITRALRQCGYRYTECVETIFDFAEKYLDFLMSVDPEASLAFDDLHRVFGAMCCVTELQQFLPGYIFTEKPLKLVLDRRPFI